MNSSTAPGAADFIARNIDLFCCPACSEALSIAGDGPTCNGCGKSYPISDGIPRMYVGNDWEDDKSDVTDRIKAFYEQTPFPNYDNYDNAASLIEKARQGVFARLLDEQLPFGTRVLEAGCGTGQLTNFLSIAHRTVIGADLCLNSLKMATSFKEGNDLDRAHFLQMNLFRPCFRTGVFDLVVSNGVLHHTSDPFLAFKTLTSLVKPKGYMIVGLYHKYGRLATDLRRVVFRWTRDRMKFLDPRNVSEGLSSGKRVAWFMDQYKNPHESKHTIREVLDWLDATGMQFVKSIPKAELFQPFLSDEHLFSKDKVGTPWEIWLKEASMALWRSQIREGGFFIVIARKAP